MVIYNLLAVFNVSSNVLVTLFIISPFAMIWLVYSILKYGIPSKKTWDDHFYEDYDYRRNGKEEIEARAN